MSDLISRLTATPVVPLVQASDPDVAVKTTQALIKGGLSVIEVVLRTDNSLACLKAIADECPDAIVGAGTVITARLVDDSVENGAKFIVAPGLTTGVVRACEERDVPLLAGVVTATELQQAYNFGLRTVKFFPAGLSGGVPMLKALSSVFRDVQFMPTGGVKASNLAEYLSVPSVLACGGSWLTPADEIAKGNYDAVTELAEEAVSIAKAARS